MLVSNPSLPSPNSITSVSLFSLLNSTTEELSTNLCAKSSQHHNVYEMMNHAPLLLQLRQNVLVSYLPYSFDERNKNPVCVGYFYLKRMITSLDVFEEIFIFSQ